MIPQLFQFTFISLCVACVAGWVAFVKHWRETGQWLPENRYQPSPIGLVDVAGVYFIWFMGQLVAAVAYSLILSPEQVVNENAEATNQSAHLDPVLIAVVILVQIAVTGLAIGFVKQRYRTWQAMGLDLEDLRPKIKYAVAAFILVIPPILLLQSKLAELVPYQHPTMDMIRKQGDGVPLMWIMAWLSAVIVAPICEEFFFRGILQAWLQRAIPPSASMDRLIGGGWDEGSAADMGAVGVGDEPNLSGTDLTSIARSQNPIVAIVLASLAFALVHLGQGPAPIPLFFLSLVLGYLFYRTGSLIPGILLHMGLNAFSLFWVTLDSIKL